MTFRLGCCLVQFNFAGYDFEDALGIIHSIGFEGVETYVPRAVLSKGKTHLRELLSRNELEPEKFVLGGYGIDAKVGNLAEQDSSRARANQRNFKKNLLIAYENGFPATVIFTGPRPKDLSVADALKLAAENLSPVADFAKDHGIEILVETHKGALAHDSASLLRLRKLAASDNIYANVDPSNYWNDGKDVVEAVTRLGPLVRGVHVKDAIKVDGKVYWAPSGSGVVDWLAFLKALKEIGYDERSGWLNIEYEAGISGKFDKDPVKGSKDGYEYISSLAREVSGT
ncbi:MAG: sugar phosphate isomerase/epimerase [Thaumarchaeota archaeon]|nr:sugar phosphate isomerase/epimerase [Nitrososphaerota archaeon]